MKDIKVKLHKPKLPTNWEFDNDKISVKKGGQSNVHDVKHNQSHQKGIYTTISNLNEDSIRRYNTSIKIITDNKIKHPNIINIFDYSKSDNEYWFISERGMSLIDYWKNVKSETLDINELFKKALDIVLKISTGLSILHRNNPVIIHRDLKPGNIIIVNNEPVLIDFGISFIDDGTPRYTNLQEGIGNIRYSPDKSIYGHLNPTPWLDIFNLSQILVWLIIEEPKKNKVWNRPLAWEYIRFPDNLNEYNAQCLRAILAISSDERLAPKNGQDFIDLINSYFPKKELKLNKIDTNLLLNSYLSSKAEKDIAMTTDSDIINSNFEAFRIQYEIIKEICKSYIDSITESITTFQSNINSEVNINDWKNEILANIHASNLNEKPLFDLNININNTPHVHFVIRGLVHPPNFSGIKSSGSIFFPSNSEFVFQIIIILYQVDKYNGGSNSLFFYVGPNGSLYIQNKQQNLNKRFDELIEVSELKNLIKFKFEDKTLWGQ